MKKITQSITSALVILMLVGIVAGYSYTSTGFKAPWFATDDESFNTSVGMGINASKLITGTLADARLTEEARNFNKSYSYLIYIDSGVYYALNGTTGVIDYSGSSAYTVVNSAYQNTGQDGHIIMSPGLYPFGTNTLVMNHTMDGFRFEQMPGTITTGTSNNSLYIIDSNMRSQFIFGNLRGGFANPISGSALLEIRPYEITTTESQKTMVISTIEINELKYGMVGLNINTTSGDFAQNTIKLNHVDNSLNRGINISDVPAGHIVEGNYYNFNYVKYTDGTSIGVYDGSGSNGVNQFRINSLDGTFGTNQNGTGLKSKSHYNMYYIGSTVNGNPAINMTAESYNNILFIGFNGAKSGGTPYIDSGTFNQLYSGSGQIISTGYGSSVLGTNDSSILIGGDISGSPHIHLLKSGRIQWTISIPTGTSNVLQFGTGSITNQMQLDNTGNIIIPVSGKGLVMHSPDGNQWCVTVANTTGAVTSTAC